MSFPRRRVIITIGLLVSIAAAVGWGFYFPFSEARLYRGAAPHAALVSEHDRLAERWPDLLANPQLTGVIKAVAGEENPDEAAAILDLLGREDVARLIALLGKERVVLSYVPQVAQRGFPCWTLSAWVGGTTQLLRWGWLDKMLGDLEPALRARSIKAWQQPLRLDGQAYHLGMVAFEGVVSLTLSRDPNAVIWMANRLLSDAPICSVNALSRPTPVATKSPDRIALQPGHINRRRALSGNLRADVTTLDAHGFDLTLAWRHDLPTAALTTATFPALPIPASMPAALACTSVRNLSATLDHWLAPDAAALVRPLLTLAHSNSPVGVALGTAAYSGRLMRVRTPSLLACARADVTAAQLGPQVRALVDRIVAASGTGLIVTDSTDMPGMVVISLAQNPTLAKLGRADLCAVMVQAGWLYLSSSPTTLATALDALEAGEAPFDGGRIWGEHPAELALWADAAPTTATISNGMAVYNLISIIGGVKGMRRLDTPAITQALAIAATLGEGRAWLSTQDGELTGRIRFQ
jgi:hypothetical protein